MPKWPIPNAWKIGLRVKVQKILCKLDVLRGTALSHTAENGCFPVVFLINYLLNSLQWGQFCAYTLRAGNFHVVCKNLSVRSIVSKDINAEVVQSIHITRICSADITAYTVRSVPVPRKECYYTAYQNWHSVSAQGEDGSLWPKCGHRQNIFEFVGPVLMT
jgi:hypothetical protein